MNEKVKKLREEVDKFKAEYKTKRKNYEWKVNICNFLMPILTLASTGFVLLSYSGNPCEDIWKIGAVVSSLLSLAVAYWGKNSNYGAKLIQRGTTYFALCELSREMEFSENPEKEYEKFEKTFENIMKRDNEMSLANSTEIVELLNKNFMRNLKYESELLTQEKIKS